MAYRLEVEFQEPVAFHHILGIYNKTLRLFTKFGIGNVAYIRLFKGFRLIADTTCESVFEDLKAGHIEESRRHAQFINEVKQSSIPMTQASDPDETLN